MTKVVEIVTENQRNGMEYSFTKTVEHSIDWRMNNGIVDIYEETPCGTTTFFLCRAEQFIRLSVEDYDEVESEDK